MWGGWGEQSRVRVQDVFRSRGDEITPDIEDQRRAVFVWAIVHGCAVGNGLRPFERGLFWGLPVGPDFLLTREGRHDGGENALDAEG